MSIADLSNVLKIFGNSKIDPSQQKALFAEALLMTSARAASSDSNIQKIEIRTIRNIVSRETGVEITDQDVRKAARTELYESAPLDKYLSSVRKQLATADKVAIVRLLAEVIKSDTTISVLEVDFFNKVAGALQTTPAEIAGIIAE
jgi:uncharacterized tellurite resistance protein B-like protein